MGNWGGNHKLILVNNETNNSKEFEADSLNWWSIDTNGIMFRINGYVTVKGKVEWDREVKQVTLKVTNEEYIKALNIIQQIME